MVADFSEVKTVVKGLLLDHMDHAFIYDENSEREQKIARLLQELNSKTFALPCRSTAENMAHFMFTQLKQHSQLPVSAIRLWETPTSFCEYRED